MPTLIAPSATYTINQEGLFVATLTGLPSATLFGVAAQGKMGNNSYTPVKFAQTVDSCPSTLSSSDLNGDGAANLALFKAEFESLSNSVTFPKSFVISGWDSNLAGLDAPMWRIDEGRSYSRNRLVIEVAYPTFSSEFKDWDEVVCEISQDSRQTWRVHETVVNPSVISSQAPVALPVDFVISPTLYQEHNVYLRFRVKKLDGTWTRYSVTLFIHGVSEDTYKIAAPVVKTITATYSDNRLDFKSQLAIDPRANAVKVEIYDYSNPNASLATNNVTVTPGTISVGVDVTGVAKFDKYILRFFAIAGSYTSPVASSVYEYSEVINPLPPAFDKNLIGIQEQVTKNADGTYTSQFLVDVTRAVDSIRPFGMVYWMPVGENDAPAAALSSFAKIGQTAATIQSTEATKNQYYDFYVAALSTDGRESAYTTSLTIRKKCIQKVVEEWTPQALPTITLEQPGTISFEGVYQRASNTEPEPVSLSFFTSTTSVQSTRLVGSDSV
ncbi:MAG: hypothetical protein MZW92_31405 [Comamonadaceae bacterium]|nr:hypothetical protein [Comamonadaceae bacterium]